MVKRSQSNNCTEGTIQNLNDTFFFMKILNNDKFINRRVRRGIYLIKSGDCHGALILTIIDLFLIILRRKGYIFLQCGITVEYLQFN